MNLNDRFADFRPSPTYPVYPPYHRGLYLEDYFYDWYRDAKESLNRTLIPVSWTTCHIEGKTRGLQEALNELDPSGKYFTVCQHDDGVQCVLPPDTIQFNAGGNSGGIAIPLVCYPLPVMTRQEVQKEYLCSFVGSVTHPIRRKIAETLNAYQDCPIVMKGWSPSVSQIDLNIFINISLKSRYILCPRGYGLNSFRLYESFQLGAVPVIITDRPFLPWCDELDWNTFSVIIDEENIPNIREILLSIKEEEYNSMLSTGQGLYSDYFTLEGVCEQIGKRVKA